MAPRVTAPPYADRRFTLAMAQDAFEEGAHPRGEGGKFSSVNEVRAAMKLKPKAHYLSNGMKAFHVHLGSDPNPIGSIHQHSHQNKRKLFGHVAAFSKPMTKWTGEHQSDRRSVGFGLSRNDVLDRIASRHYLANKKT